MASNSVVGHRWRVEVWFEVDAPPGEPSKFPTFYGTRVLDCEERDHSQGASSPSLS
jgi:hypothetical protein